MALAILSLLAANALHMPSRPMLAAAPAHAHHDDAPAPHDQATSGCHVCRLAGSLEVPPPNRDRAIMVDDQWTDYPPLDPARPARGPPAA